MTGFPLKPAPLAHNVHFVTARTFAQRPLFQTDRVARFFLATIFRSRQEHICRLYEFVLMPDHCHLLLAPAPALGLEQAVQIIRGRFAYRLRKELELNLEVWERDYEDYRISDSHDFARHADYIREKAVHARLTLIAEHYPYSSACHAFELDPCPAELKMAAPLRA